MFLLLVEVIRGSTCICTQKFMLSELFFIGVYDCLHDIALFHWRLKKNYSCLTE